MALRIGSLVLNTNVVLLLFAGLFFALISYRQLRQRHRIPRYEALATTFLACLGGVLGACVYGTSLFWQYGQPALSSGAWSEFRFGSLGGLWGILIATALGAAISRRPILKRLDAMVLGLGVSMAVARISCLFCGCCLGIVLDSDLLRLQPFRHVWPLYDMAASLGSLVLVMHYVRRGKARARDGLSVFAFLACYGALRFLLEFVKDTFPMVGPFTWGHALSLVGVVAGVAGVAILAKTDRRPAAS